MHKPLNYYVDSYNMLTKVTGPSNPKDGGDSAQRIGMFFSGVKLLDHFDLVVPSEYVDGLQSYEDSISGLYNRYGVWRRHPDENRWYGEFDRMSRDQSIGIIVSLGLYKKWSVLLLTFLNHLLLRGLLFMTNTRKNGSTKENDGEEYSPGKLRNYSWKLPDPTFLEYWGLYIRCLPKSLGVILYPVLLLADTITLIGGLVRNKNDDNDVLNHCIVSVNASVNLPTPVSRLANKLTDWDKMEDKLNKYFDDTEPPLHKIWIPLIKQL